MSGSWIDPYYSTGRFKAKSGGARDAAFKVAALQKLLAASRHVPSLFPLHRIADVGCGSGATTFLLREMCEQAGYGDAHIDGYDVHPDIAGFAGSETVKFVQGDFCTADVPTFDLAVLFDVVEHVPAPAEFLRQVAARARFVALHIPLDDSIFSWLRNLPRQNLSHPGHLIVLDPASALNLLAMGGLRTLGFDYAPVFRAPSGLVGRAQRLLNLLRGPLYRLSPYLLQKTLGGVSLMVLTACQQGEP